MEFKSPPRTFLWITAGVLLSVILYQPAWAATAATKYYAAERCTRDLKSNARHQKYRDRWMRCIKKFLAVYRDDPHGPWAAAGLYQAGLLYGDLYKRSYLESDRRQAIDLLDTVANHYPKSSYRQRARAAYDRLKERPNTQEARQKSPDAGQFYEKAQAQAQRLQEKPRLQKYRDQWLKSINLYRRAFQADPHGALAPAALYGLADSYAGLYRWSHSSLDRLQSQKTFQELVSTFPQSSYAEKASARIEHDPQHQENNGLDAIAQVLQSSDTSGTTAVQTAPRNDSAQQEAVIQGLRYWSNPRYTRVVIDASTDTTFTSHELHKDFAIGKPHRIYIDVHNSRLSQDLQKVVSINDNLLSDARAAQYTADTVRVVVDIKSSKTYKIFPLKNPFRIVLDVWGIDVEAPAATNLTPPVIAEKNSTKLPDGAIVKQLALGVRRIIIDPGHGGKDSGALGAIRGVQEKRITLQIGRKLAAKIRSQLGCDVIMTRKDDTFVSLEERTAIANTKDADLFISIHCNASPDHRATGLETFILNLATDNEAILVAARENATSTKNISDLDSILKDLMRNAKVSESTRLASYVQQTTLFQVHKKYHGILNKGVKKAPFYVLLGANMPSILIETGFISNREECRRLMNSNYQDHIAQGILDGVKRYIQAINPMALERADQKKKEKV
jgi:N-acetylmuramoyl-L-alanine amidase